MKKFRTLEDFDFTGKRVLVRVDFNLPLNEFGYVRNDTRIRMTLPTIQYLLDRDAKVILMTHLGRPDGKIVEEFKLDKIALKLADLLNLPVKKADDCVGPEVEEMVKGMRCCTVLLLENLRFHPEEEADDDAFARRLARLADIYVNDSFGVDHRAHASVEAIQRYLPSCAGMLVQKEIDIMGKTFGTQKRPFVAVLGGSKVSDKIAFIESLLDRVDHLLIGGAMMFTFLKARGFDVGRSKVEDDYLEMARKIMAKDGKLVLPVDCVVAKEISAVAEADTVDVDNIPRNYLGLDIGPKTVKLFEQYLKNAGTIVWNGPMGVFEVEQFGKGTEAIAAIMAESSAITIVGGGDSAAAVDKIGVSHRMTHVSTGGGASLEYLEGRHLPALKALEENYVLFKDGAKKQEVVI